ncbi:MAG: hypothetical protein DRI90_02185 [Deltaproteobacteria bacterium]|nr:MAG: hypothetical protein DRI90_02185 [Deltaproteobacteria bacterium]
MSISAKTGFHVGALLIATAVLGSGCVTDLDESDTESGKPDSDGKIVDGKADAWNSTNNPSRFRVEFDYELANLPMSGAAEVTPWPDTYWPTYKDSTNQRWQGTDVMSPLEKYDAAFNGWEPGEGFMELRPFNPGNCTAEWDKEYYDRLGPAASYMSKNKGNAKARDGVDSDDDGEIDECGDNDGVESWWGLCHAWVPASILEKEPQHSVTHNGVTFEVGDIKGLLQTVYDRSSAMMLGGRCNEKEVERDEHGRITADHCRDTNAGAFHVVVTNMMGIHKRSFAEDRTYDYQVWNQPFRSYEVLSQEEIDAKTAMAAMGQPDAEQYAYNEDATRFAKVRTRVKYITEPHQTSTEPLVPKVENNNAYTGSDTYEYILEMTAEGEIIGGEWIGYSQTTHPDFLWLPTQARGGNPNVDIDMVRELLELSTMDDPPPVSQIATFENTTVLDIPDNDDQGITSTITVDDDITIGSLKVAVEIDHSYIGDLQVVLEKDGIKVPLHEQTGAGADDLHETFEVTEHANLSARGTWTLSISDHANRDVGKLKSWSLLVSNTPAATPTEHAAADLPISIPDNDDEGIISILNVTEAGNVDTAKVKLALTHTYVGDLTITLTHGGGSQVLHSREGGSSNNLNKTFTTTAFEGGPLAGDWTLTVTDEAGQDVGALDSWSLLATTQ